MQFLDAERAFLVGIEFVEQIGGGLLGFVDIDGAIIIRIELADRSRPLLRLCECHGRSSNQTQDGHGESLASRDHDEILRKGCLRSGIFNRACPY